RSEIASFERVAIVVRPGPGLAEQQLMVLGGRPGVGAEAAPREKPCTVTCKAEGGCTITFVTNSGIKEVPMVKGQKIVIPDSNPSPWTCVPDCQNSPACGTD